MHFEIRSVGGYNEVGKNMTAIRIENEVFILDMGSHLENYIRLSEEDDLVRYSVKDLADAGAIPDISMIGDWRPLVSAIIPTHAHLDHVGAIPFLGNKFTAPILCTPFTAEVISAILRDERIKIRNEIKKVNPNSIVKISDTVTIEFLNSTHSTPQTIIVALHTPRGVILYANDFKFDSFPTMGKKPNIKRLQELGEEGKVHSLIVDSTYAWDWRKMPSESVAKEMLKDVLLGTDCSGKLVIVTTFSSHLSRLKSIIEFGKEMGRKVVFMGRSMSKYIEAGERAGIIDFSDVEVVKYAKKVAKRFKEIGKERSKYIVVCTGHQGEPKSVLSKLASGKLDFKLEAGDHIVFSCTVIPTETNKKNRDHLEQNLKDLGVRVFKDIHVSGHAAREDLRDLITLVKPKNIIPAHGNFKMTSALADLAVDIGYEDSQVHLLQNGDRLTF